MQEIGKFNLKINVIPNWLEKHMKFTINNKLSFIGSFQFLSSSLDSLVKNLSKDDFKYLNQQFDNNMLDLVKQKLFCPYEYMSDLYMSLRKNWINWNKFKIKKMKNYQDLYLKCDVILLADA